MGQDGGGERGQRRCVERPLFGVEQRAEMRIGEDQPTPSALGAVAENQVQVHMCVGVHQEGMVVLVRREQLLQRRSALGDLAVQVGPFVRP